MPRKAGGLNWLSLGNRPLINLEALFIGGNPFEDAGAVTYNGDAQAPAANEPAFQIAY
jgi:hypothetical protein